MPRTVTDFGTLTPVRIQHGGRDYNGHYHVAEGVLFVSSAYGGPTARLEGEDPEELAQSLLREAVQSWRPGKLPPKARSPKPKRSG